MIITSIIYGIINILILIAAINDREVVFKDVNWRGSIAMSLLILSIGTAVLIMIILVYSSKPFWVRYKCMMRRRKIRKAQLTKALRDQPKDINLIDF